MINFKLLILFSFLFPLMLICTPIYCAKVKQLTSKSLSKAEELPKEVREQSNLEELDREINLLSSIIKLLNASVSETSNNINNRKEITEKVEPADNNTSYESIKTESFGKTKKPVTENGNDTNLDFLRNKSLKSLNEAKPEILENEAAVILNDDLNSDQNKAENGQKYGNRTKRRNNKLRKTPRHRKTRDALKKSKPLVSPKRKHQNRSSANKRNWRNRQQNENLRELLQKQDNEEQDLQEGVCSKGFQKVYDSFNCYMVSLDTYKSYFEATDFCKSKGAEPFAPRTPYEIRLIFNWAKTKLRAKQLWTGWNKVTKQLMIENSIMFQKRYYEDMDGNDMSNTLWDAGQPKTSLKDSSPGCTLTNKSGHKLIISKCFKLFHSHYIVCKKAPVTQNSQNETTD